MAKKKIQLQDANGNVLHPLTLGECVTMSNGENLDTLMSKSQMFTPTITQDKSMFKVGTGVDVDYSANVKDGAYESLVFKGKSLVNLIPAKTVFEKQAIGGTSGWRNSYLPLTQELKTNTIYTLFYKLETETKVQISIGGKSGDAFLPKSEPIREVGTHYVQTLLTTKPETSNSMSHLYMQFPDNFDVGTVKATNMVLLEGNYMDFNVPYFEGICDSKMPILRNVGKNLCDTSKYVHGGLSNNNMIFSKNKYRSYYMKCKPSTVYTVKVENSNNRFGVGSSHLFSEDTAFTLNKYWTTPSSDVTGQTLQHTVTTAEKDKYLYVYVANNGVFSPDIRVQVEEAPSPTSYEDHKTNILRTSEEIVLRSLPNGVCDTYDARTGEYVKRIGERTLNGSEAWIANSGTDKQFEDVWVFHNQESLCNGTVRLCDKLQARENANENAEFIRGGGTYIFVYISKNKVQNHNANDFKTWLSQNPITVQYELAEPVTTIVKPSTMTPFAYQNGHVIVESGHEGQSLLPEIEYSVVTGRAGQVTQNTKVLRKQEQQIIGLEELLLTQVVQMEYERTLLQFDYELQMMMLG